MSDTSSLILNGYYNPNRSAELQQWLHIFQTKHTSPLPTWEPDFSETREGVRKIAIAIFAFGLVVGFSASFILYGGNALSFSFTGHLISNLEGMTMLGVGCMIAGIIAYISAIYRDYWRDPAFCQEKREAEIEQWLAHCKRPSWVLPTRSPAPLILVTQEEQRLMYKGIRGWTIPQATFNMTSYEFLQEDNTHLTFSDFFDRYGWSCIDRSKCFKITSLDIYDPSIQRIFAKSLATDFETLGFEGCINKYYDIHFRCTRTSDLLTLMYESEHRTKVQEAFLDHLVQCEPSSCLEYAPLLIQFGDVLIPESRNQLKIDLLKFIADARKERNTALRQPRRVAGAPVKRAPRSYQNFLAESRARHEATKARWTALLGKHNLLNELP